MVFSSKCGSKAVYGYFRSGKEKVDTDLVAGAAVEKCLAPARIPARRAMTTEVLILK